MPDQEVLINESNLNAIANAIRRKNGLVRTYKPREMAPAIKQIGASAPDSRGFTVTVRQSPHQNITVKQSLGGEKQYDQSFTVSEPYWKVQATIEPETGYIAGVLNHAEEITLDRDITISASPAAKISSPPDEHQYIYWKGKGTSVDYHHMSYFSDEECTQPWGFYRESNPRSMYRPQGNVVYHFIDKNENGAPYIMSGVFGGTNYAAGNICPDATHIINDFNPHGAVTITDVSPSSQWLEYIDLSGWDVSTAESISGFMVRSMPYLKSIGNISYWNTQSLRSISNFMASSRFIHSLDLSNWNTPELISATDVFTGDEAYVLDISNWDTSKLTSFSFGNKMKYLIMDKPEIKFSGSYIFSNHTNCKYLVPEEWVDDYKQHPNWQSRASQIDSVTNYTINRGNGQVEVVPNW